MLDWYISFFFFLYIINVFGYAGSSLLCRPSLVGASGGCSLVSVHGLLIVVASPVAEHGLCGAWASVVTAYRL